jgi:hypothetical protein
MSKCCASGNRFGRESGRFFHHRQKFAHLAAVLRIVIASVAARQQDRCDGGEISLWLD